MKKKIIHHFYIMKKCGMEIIRHEEMTCTHAKEYLKWMITMERESNSQVS